MDSPSCAVCSALPLLHPSIVSITESVWPNFGSSAVAQGDFANIPSFSKAAKHKGQLLPGWAIWMRQKNWACPSALSWLLPGCQLKELGAASAGECCCCRQGSCSAANPCRQQPSLKPGICNPAAGSQSFWLEMRIWEGGVPELDAKLMVQFNSPIHLLVCKGTQWNFWLFFMFCALALRKQRAERLDESRVRKHTESSNYLTKPSNTLTLKILSPNYFLTLGDNIGSWHTLKVQQFCTDVCAEHFFLIAV